MLSNLLVYLALLVPLLLLAALITPPWVCIILFVRKKFKACAIILGIYVSLIGAFFLDARLDRRSFPGRIVRLCQGAGLLKQDVEDQVEDLRRSNSLPRIQNWAAETTQRFRAGNIRTNGTASYWSTGSVKLAQSEIPEFVAAQWRPDDQPEFSVVISDSGEPKFVVAAWHDKGVALGDATFRLPMGSDEQQVIPGVEVYYLER